MKPTINCITLPVDDLQRSLVFYRDGLRLPTDGSTGFSLEEDHIAIELQGGLYLVLIQRARFSQFTRLSRQSASEAAGAAPGCMLSYFAGSHDEVDALVASAVAAGGQAGERPSQQEWGYAGYVKDPDGHLWEISWNLEIATGLGTLA